MEFKPLRLQAMVDIRAIDTTTPWLQMVPQLGCIGHLETNANRYRPVWGLADLANQFHDMLFGDLALLVHHCHFRLCLLVFPQHDNHYYIETDPKF